MSLLRVDVDLVLLHRQRDAAVERLLECGQLGSGSICSADDGVDQLGDPALQLAHLRDRLAGGEVAHRRSRSWLLRCITVSSRWRWVAVRSRSCPVVLGAGFPATPDGRDGREPARVLQVGTLARDDDGALGGGQVARRGAEEPVICFAVAE
jgi:hypothetical protein